MLHPGLNRLQHIPLYALPSGSSRRTDDETGRVHHLVDPDSNDPRTLYPYIPATGGGWDNACGSLTLSALRGRMARNTIRFA